MNLSTDLSRDAAAGVSATSARVNRQTEHSAGAFKTGDIFTAVLTERDGDNATLRLDDGTLLTTSSAVRGGVGEKLTFEVVKSDKKGLSLKQINRPDNAPRRSRAELKDITPEITAVNKTIEKIGDEDRQRNEEYREQQQKAARAVARIQRAQVFLSGCEAKSAAAVLVESGLSLDKVSFTVLTRVMREADKRPASAPTGSEWQQALSLPFKNTADAPRILQSLHRNGLALQEKNIAQLERTWEAVRGGADDTAIAQLIESEDALTPERLYVGRHSSAPVQATTSGRREAPDLDALAEQVRALFKREGIADTQAHRDAARFLLERDLPLEKNTVEKTVFLRRLSHNISQADVFEKAAEALSKDLNPQDIPIQEIVGADRTRRAQEAEAKDRTARVMPLLMRLAPGTGEADRAALLRSLTDAPGIRFDERIAARRLIETQLKYTSEAAARLTDTGIRVDTAPLREALSFLTTRENEEYARYLRMAGEERPQAVPRMTELFDTLTALKPLTVNTHADLLLNRSEYSLRGAHESVLAARAKEGYETFATVPSLRYGDSFNRVREQFAPLLTSLDIASTGANLKAAFILSKNNMDVNSENLEAVKAVDAKLNAVVNNLHPAIAAQMLKDGLQPLDMQLDQVLAYIRQYKETLGEDGADKIAQYIMEMDNDRALDADTRKSMIAVYRMLHVIQKDGAAALGLAARMNEPMTLGALMDLAKYHKNKPGSVDLTSDENAGMLERLSRPEGSIRAILEQTRRPAIGSADLAADAFTDIASPQFLRALLEDIPDGEDLPLEDIPEMDLPELRNADWNAAVTQLNMFLSASPGLIAYLQNRGIPATVPSLKALEKLTRSSGALREAFEDLDLYESIDEADDAGDSSAFNNEAAETLAQALPDAELRALREGRTTDEIYKRALAALDSLPAESAEEAERVTAAKALLELRGALNEDGGFQIPVRINGRVCGLNLYVLNEEAMTGDGARVLLSLDTRTLGTVQGYFTVNDERLELQITAETPDALARLHAEEDVLKRLLAEAGIEEASVTYALTEKPSGSVLGPHSTAASDGLTHMRGSGKAAGTKPAHGTGTTEGLNPEHRHEYKV